MERIALFRKTVALRGCFLWNNIHFKLFYVTPGPTRGLQDTYFPVVTPKILRKLYQKLFLGPVSSIIYRGHT